VRARLYQVRATDAATNLSAYSNLATAITPAATLLPSMILANLTGPIIQLQAAQLGEAVRQIALDWRPAMASHQIRFAEAICGHDVLVAGDRMAISRLLNILLDNAAKYTPSGGSIELTLEARNEKAVIVVSDTGIGISDEDQPRIFERFYRGDKARSREIGGAGLGLAIAHWIVAQHRGRITVESTLGKGATFVVELPLQRVEAATFAHPSVEG
jgi:signal transduction histidine kinase